MTLTPVEGSAAYFETRDKIAAARERQLAAALAENARLRALIADACVVFEHYDLPEHAFHYRRTVEQSGDAK